jgi:hypothetical protein
MKCQKPKEVKAIKKKENRGLERHSVEERVSHCLSAPSTNHYHCTYPLMGFPRTYLLVWVLAHLIGGNNDPPIPRLGKLHNFVS